MAEKQTGKTKEERYIEAVGRRKTASARVRITPAKENSFVVNDKPLEEFFSVADYQKTVRDPLQLEAVTATFDVSAKVIGGGVRAQAEAIRHGLARAIVEYNEDYRDAVKDAGFLKRDPRKKERKKPGLRKARRAPQWSKR